jgi:hypothetical protein
VVYVDPGDLLIKHTVVSLVVPLLQRYPNAGYVTALASLAAAQAAATTAVVAAATATVAASK